MSNHHQNLLIYYILWFNPANHTTGSGYELMLFSTPKHRKSDFRAVTQKSLHRFGAVADTPIWRNLSEARLFSSARQVERGTPQPTKINQIMAQKNEKSSARVSSIAGKVLQTGKATPTQAKALAGSVMTQAPNHKKGK